MTTFDLNDLVETVAQMKREVSVTRRPLVIEFCGTPKSSKTTTIDAVKNFLANNGFKVAVIHEKAKVCPIRDKFDPMFNFWTGTTSINELIEVLDKNELYYNHEKYDVVICDRGVFDSLCWFTWLKNNGSLYTEEYEMFTRMLIWKGFRSKVDKIFLFHSSPGDSLEREPCGVLTQNKSQIMKGEVLSDFNMAVDEACNTFKSQFVEKIEHIDSKVNDEMNIKFRVAELILNVLAYHYDESVACIDKADISLPNQSAMYPFSMIGNSLVKMQYHRRKDVENDDNFIQIIPIAAIVDGDKILCVKKTKRSLAGDGFKAPEKSKNLFYVGGHVRTEDSEGISDINVNSAVNTIKNALVREIQEETHLRLIVPNGEPKLIYSIAMEKSKRHLALLWVIDVNTNKFNIKLDGNELLEHKGTTNSGKFFRFCELTPSMQLEDWSRLLLLNEFGDQLSANFKNYLMTTVNIEQISFFDLEDPENE